MALASYSITRMTRNALSSSEFIALTGARWISSPDIMFLFFFFYRFPFYIPQFPVLSIFVRSSSIRLGNYDRLAASLRRKCSRLHRPSRATFYRFFNRVTQFAPTDPSCRRDITAGRKKEPLVAATCQLKSVTKEDKMRPLPLSLSPRKPVEEQTSDLCGSECERRTSLDILFSPQDSSADRDVAIISCDPITRAKRASTG